MIRTYDLGVNSFITKPVTFSSLVDVMGAWTNYWFEIVELPGRGTAMRESRRILLVEDDEDDYLITRDLLAAKSCPFRARLVRRLRGRSDRDPARRHDAYLIDYRLGQHTGLDLVREGFGSGPRAPVILLTGQDDYEIDLEATALGVADYVTKQALDATGLERAIRYAISHSGALSDLARTEERYALATRAANDGIWDWDLVSDRIYLSHRWHAILGLEEPIDDGEPDRWFELVHPDDVLHLRAAIDSHLAGRTSTWSSNAGCATPTADGSGCSAAGSRSATARAPRPGWQDRSPTSPSVRRPRNGCGTTRCMTR